MEWWKWTIYEEFNYYCNPMKREETKQIKSRFRCAECNWIENQQLSLSRKREYYLWWCIVKVKNRKNVLPDWVRAWAEKVEWKWNICITHSSIFRLFHSFYIISSSYYFLFNNLESIIIKHHLLRYSVVHSHRRLKICFVLCYWLTFLFKRLRLKENKRLSRSTRRWWRRWSFGSMIDDNKW